jgi:hypothetical protein
MRSNAKPSEKKREKESSSTGPQVVTPTPPLHSATSGGVRHRIPGLSESQLQEVMAMCQAFILRLVPKALKAFDQALSSDNPRLQMTAAVKLFEGIGLLGSRGNDNFRETAEDLEQREQEKSLIVAGLLWKTMMDKAEIYKMPLPDSLTWLAPKVRAIQQEIVNKRNAGGLDNHDPDEIPPLRSHLRRDQSNGGVRGYGKIIQKESTEP